MEKDPKPHTEYEILAEEFKTFVYSVSHDLSAPIRGMVEFSKLLKNEHGAALNDEGQLYLSLIIESGDKLNRMLAGLLSYSRLNTRASSVTTVDTQEALNNCLGTMKDRLEGAKASVESGNLPTVRGDKDLIEQIFSILIDNAALYKESGAEPKISVTAEDQGNVIVFAVKDNGIGIEPDYLEHVFQSFKRLHGDGEYPGIGMGLALARKMVERHKGQIWIEPQKEKGTTVKFSLAKG